MAERATVNEIVQSVYERAKLAGIGPSLADRTKDTSRGRPAALGDETARDCRYQTGKRQKPLARTAGRGITCTCDRTHPPHETARDQLPQAIFFFPTKEGSAQGAKSFIARRQEHGGSQGQIKEKRRGLRNQKEHPEKSRSREEEQKRTYLEGKKRGIQRLEQLSRMIDLNALLPDLIELPNDDVEFVQLGIFT